MPNNLVEWAAVISAACAVVGLPYLWSRSKSKNNSTKNTIKGGSRNKQTGSAGITENFIKNGDDNQQGG